MLTQVLCGGPKIYTLCNTKNLADKFLCGQGLLLTHFQKNLSTKYFEYTIQFSSVGKFMISPA